MPIGRRLINLLRAEVNARVGRFSGLAADDSKASPDPDPTAAKSSKPRAALLRQYYANLELPAGASWAEVKSAYRRLMRRYHPDRHAADPAKSRVANELSQQLRVAYEALRDELAEK